MNRADFLKRLGLGAIGIAVAPMVRTEECDEDILTQEEEDIIKQEIKMLIKKSPPAKVMLIDKNQQWSSIYDTNINSVAYHEFKVGDVTFKVKQLPSFFYNIK